MSKCRLAYQGDEVLERLLRKAGSAYGVADLGGLLAGVEAAPAPAEADAWMELVAPAASDALKAQLAAYRAEIAPVRPGAKDGTTAMPGSAPCGRN